MEFFADSSTPAPGSDPVDRAPPWKVVVAD
ncbi:MAG: hypothetical protein RLY86_3511, partial [Pseudomonadota bacterium]